jgi:hypothetical protein
VEIVAANPVYIKIKVIREHLCALIEINCSGIETAEIVWTFDSSGQQCGHSGQWVTGTRNFLS